jgi:hypothetical protein
VRRAPEDVAQVVGVLGQLRFLLDVLLDLRGTDGGELEVVGDERLVVDGHLLHLLDHLEVAAQAAILVRELGSVVCQPPKSRSTAIMA